MSDETKTPQADEWWVNSKGYIRYIVGLKRSGSIVWEDSTSWSFANDNSDWNDWHHEPRCTGFDWTEPPAIDPGDGWELLPVGTVIDERDEYSADGKKWWPTQCAGEAVQPGNTYRRRKPPAEVWPKYYEALYQGHAYIKRLSEAKYIVVNTDGTEGMEFKWKSHIGDNRKQITEAEALARVKPTAETWPKYYVGKNWSDADAYIRFDNATDVGVWVSADGSEDKHDEAYSDAREHVYRHMWFPVTEAEALARVKTANPLPALIPGIATDRMVDLFLSWRLPSDFQPDGGISFTSRSIHENWPTGTNLFTAMQARAMLNHVLSVPADSDAVSRRPNSGQYDADLSEGSPGMALETAKQWLEDNPEDPPPFANPFTNSRSGTGIPKNNAPVELPDDWVDLPETHILRADIDQVLYEHDTINYWQEVCPSAGMRLNDSQYKRARCRRRDLPATPAPIEQERWFMWSDDRYPIAFVKRAGGKVFNLNVDGMFKTSDDWCARYEEHLIDGEMIEVTEASAKAYLRRPRRKIIEAPAPQPKTMDVSPGEGWRWVEKDEPWQEGDDCLICDFTHPHTHNCQCWRRRIVPQPKRTPVRLFVSADVRWGDRYIVSVKDGNPNPERHQEIKFDGSGFYVEGGE